MKKYLVFNCLGIYNIHPYQFDFSLKNIFSCKKSVDLTSRIPAENSAIPQKLSFFLFLLLTVLCNLAAYSQSAGTNHFENYVDEFVIEGKILTNTSISGSGNWIVNGDDGGMSYATAGVLLNTFPALNPNDVCSKNDQAREGGDKCNDQKIARGNVAGSTNNTETGKTTIPSGIDDCAGDPLSFAGGSKYFRSFLLPIPILPLYS